MMQRASAPIVGVVVVVAAVASGCVSQTRHEQVLDELKKVRQEAAQQAVEDENRLAEAQLANKRIAAQLEDLEKGKITIQQLRDRLTITVVDRVLFESGSDAITPEGRDVLNRVGAALKDVRDRQIHISGHTDNVQIGPSLRGRFKTNWELSTARATSVVRYLVDHADVVPQLLTAVGHAYTKPVADNDSEEGRSRNRRIEIILYPKDLKNIAAELDR
ncbi:MAG TPA: flagellar motor protein MotB [Nitrospira sp.]|nr:flagellar motor protein MotB [Nitrospira sp.]